MQRIYSIEIPALVYAGDSSAPKGFTRVLETRAPAVEKQLKDFNVRNYVRNSKKGAEPGASSKSKTQEPKKKESKRKETVS
jgi:hypothetical protein